MKPQTAADIVRRTRKKHPDRARYQSLKSVARQSAANTVANRHYDEYQEEFRKEMRRRKLPMSLPPLPPTEDGRINKNGKRR